MTEDAPSTGPGRPQGGPADPPTVTPADGAAARPAPGPAATPPPTAPTAVAGPPPTGTTPPGTTPTGTTPTGTTPTGPTTGATTAVINQPPPPPAAPVARERRRRPGLGLLPVAIGVGLLAAAVVLSATRSRADGDLDWSNYAVGLGATAVLLLVALVAAVLGRGRDATDDGRVRDDGRGREELVTWPGAFGILGAGLMLGIGLEGIDGSEDWLPYLVGGVIVLLSAVGYVAVRRGAFVVTGILGLGLAYIQLADDVLVDIGDDDDQAIIAAATIAVFVLAVTALGWLLRTRAISGVVAGVIGIIGLNAVLLALVVAQTFAPFFGMEVFGAEASADPFSRPDRPDYDNDVYIILAIAAVLTLLWALAAALDGNPGFTVLAIAMPATIVPMATVVLAIEHPTWWGVGLAAVGALLLGLVALKQLLARKKRH